MGTSGSVDFMFVRKGVFRVKNAGLNLEDLEFELIDAGLDDMKVEDDELVIYSTFTEFGAMSKALEEKGIEVINAELQRIPTMTKKLNDDEIESIIKLIDRLEDDEDVANVFTTMDMSE